MDYQLRRDFEGVFVAENASIVGEVSIGRNSSVWYGAALRGDEGLIDIGEGTSVQECAVIHTATKIGDRCTIGHGAIVHGAVIGNNVLVGMGSIILNGAKIADNCFIGAGALVTSKMDAPEGSLILGSPARVIRPCSEKELAEINESAEEYIERTKELIK